MDNQEFTLTMHTLNKYGVPCTDVTEYVTRSGGGDPATFYMQKSPAQVLMFSKMKPIPGGEIPDPYDPITGIEGYVFCVFRNDAEEFGNKGYCDYYSLASGSLMASIELPYMVGDGFQPSVDINTSLEVYDAVSYDGQPPQYARFRRDSLGYLTIEGHVLAQTNFYYPSQEVFLGGFNDYTGDPLTPPRDLPYTSFDPETDKVTLANHGFVDGENEWILFTFSGTPPGGLVSNKWYVVINVDGDTFQLAKNPYDVKVWTATPIDFTYQGSGYATLIVDYGDYCYDGNDLLNDPSSMLPSRIKDGYLYSNKFGEERQTGRLYYETLPDLSSNTGTYKRRAAGYIDLFVGQIKNFTTTTPFYNLLDPNFPHREQYTYPTKIFDDQIDDGSGKYTIGSGQIQAYFYNNSLLIFLSFDDIRGQSGNQLYQKWYNSGGQFMYEWVFPFYTDSEGNQQPYYLTGRLNHEDSFFYVLGNQETNESYLRQYNLWTGNYTETKLENPYKDESTGGFYKITNLQLIDNQYIMVHLSKSNGHNVFFKAFSPHLGIQGEIVLDVTNDVTAFRVIPSIGMTGQSGSSVTNKLLQLCNSFRHLKMTWALNQVQACQDHANWCVANGVFQHEGPVAGVDAATSLRNRNTARGVSGGLAENLSLVYESDEDTEVTLAFEGWKDSPHHWDNIIRAGNKYMSYAVATYPASCSQIISGPGMHLGGGSYSTETEIIEIPDHLRGKYKIYVQNFIWY